MTRSRYSVLGEVTREPRAHWATRAMGTVISPSVQVMSDPLLEDEDTLVDGVSLEEHARYHDALPWYALPVANLCSDANLGAWSGISLVLFALKFFAVAAETTATVAALVLCVSVLTATAWFAVFVLLGSEDQRALYREMPVGKIAQTFWVGAIACPIAVYAVRAAIGAAMTLVLPVMTPEEVIYGTSGDYEDAYGEDAYGDGDSTGKTASSSATYNAVLVAFVVAYLAAGLAEETAKYFGVARYYPTWDLLRREGRGDDGRPGPPGGKPSPVDDARPVDDAAGDLSSSVSEKDSPWKRRGCASPAAGWFTPARNPRVVVYLAFVVGLGFSFTENIQYGANVYVQATAWGEQGNVTMIRNVMLNPFPGHLVLDPTERSSSGESLGFAEASTAEQFSENAPKQGDIFGSAAREVLEVVSNTFLNWSGDKDERVVRADVDAALAAALEETRARVGESEDAGEWPVEGSSSNSEGQTTTVNISVRREPYTEESKWGAAATVTLMRGAAPMHAVWAGLTSTRYVSRLWVDRNSNPNPLACIAWSWLYHGTFDFAIMAAPALMQSGMDDSTYMYVFVALGTVGFATMVSSWVHLAVATFALENDLTKAGFVHRGKGNGVPRLGLCTGVERRLCRCVCMPCVWVLCPGVGEWDDAGEKKDEEGGIGEGYGSTL
jgi:hypothetical protein